jgi:hypothetical protein
MSARIEWKEEHGGGLTWAWGVFRVVPKAPARGRTHPPFDLTAVIGYREPGAVVSAWWFDDDDWKLSECFGSEADAYPWLMELACHAARLFEEHVRTRDAKCGWCTSCHRRLPGGARPEGEPNLCIACGGF